MHIARKSVSLLLSLEMHIQNFLYEIIVLGFIALIKVVNNSFFIFIYFPYTDRSESQSILIIHKSGPSRLSVYIFAITQKLFLFKRTRIFLRFSPVGAAFHEKSS